MWQQNVRRAVLLNFAQSQLSQPCAPRINSLELTATTSPEKVLLPSSEQQSNGNARRGMNYGQLKHDLLWKDNEENSASHQSLLDARFRYSPKVDAIPTQMVIATIAGHVVTAASTISGIARNIEKYYWFYHWGSVFRRGLTWNLRYSETGGSTLAKKSGSGDYVIKYGLHLWDE